MVNLRSRESESLSQRSPFKVSAATTLVSTSCAVQEFRLAGHVTDGIAVRTTASAGGAGGQASAERADADAKPESLPFAVRTNSELSGSSPPSVADVVMLPEGSAVTVHASWAEPLSTVPPPWTRRSVT